MTEKNTLKPISALLCPGLKNKFRSMKNVRKCAKYGDTIVFRKKCAKIWRHDRLQKKMC